ncbi:MAG TPA: acyl-protein synthetase [Eubacteriales bacterium]|nr:acyl-protein synthetase [Eubacteriales bacterium]
MTNLSKLFFARNPYKTKSTEAFLEAVRENVRFQQTHCPAYAKILAQRGFSPEELQSEADLFKIPPLPTLYFKRNRLLSVPQSECVLTAASSGTRGQKSFVAFDRKTMFYGIGMAVRFFQYYHLITPIPAHYVVLGYEPSGHADMGAIKTAYGVTKFAPALSRTYALRDAGGTYEPNMDDVVRSLERHAKSGFPVRLVGFPPLLYFLVRELERRGVQFRLARGSKILLGGGWKRFGGEAAGREALFSMAEHALGIPRKDMFEFFSAVEHPLAYMRCKNGRFHVPAYARALVRDPATLQPVQNGEPGLLNLITPLVSSMPLVSVMTDDIAIVRPGEDCGCGSESPCFELLGRAGVRGIKTCAAGAAERAQGGGI